MARALRRRRSGALYDFTVSLLLLTLSVGFLSLTESGRSLGMRVEQVDRKVTDLIELRT